MKEANLTVGDFPQGAETKIAITGMVSRQHDELLKEEILRCLSEIEEALGSAWDPPADVEDIRSILPQAKRLLIHLRCCMDVFTPSDDPAWLPNALDRGFRLLSRAFCSLRNEEWLEELKTAPLSEFPDEFVEANIGCFQELENLLSQHPVPVSENSTPESGFEEWRSEISTRTTSQTRWLLEDPESARIVERVLFAA